jgi:hypothetical protein
MDASQITKLLQQQNTRTLSRSQTVDSSTLTWQTQIRSSTYIKGVHTSVPTQVNPQGGCSYGGQGKQMTIMTGSTQTYPSVFSAATGSATRVYSSEAILLQKAGQHACSVATDRVITLPACDCTDTNGPTASLSDPPINHQANPYLPAFDTYHALKNPCFPTQDQNQKHYVSNCCP